MTNGRSIIFDGGGKPVNYYNNDDLSFDFIVEFSSGDADSILPDRALASVSLPPSLFAGITRDPVGIFFALYTESTLFPVRNIEQKDNSTLTSEVASPIVAVTVGPGLNFDDINPPVMINLRIINNFEGFVST